jgi:hypothetical protein
MDYEKKAMECLVSDNPAEVHRGMGLALLALAEEFRKYRTESMPQRGPERGDRTFLYCSVCKKETKHLFGVFVEEDIHWWYCTICKRRIKL